VQCRWIKIIDSLGSTEPDEGTFTPLPNGDDIETGSMPCAEKGNRVTDYEEVWRKLSPPPGTGHGWILQSLAGMTFLGRIGGAYMALSEEEGRRFGARSEEWDVENGWRVKYAIGDVEEVPSFANIGSKLLDGEAAWRIGETVVVLGKKNMLSVPLRTLISLSWLKTPYYPLFWCNTTVWISSQSDKFSPASTKFLELPNVEFLVPQRQSGHLRCSGSWP
jgi:Protein HRI1